VLKHMEDYEPALRRGLDIHGKGQNAKDTAAIAATEKTWVHKSIDRHRRLRSLFREVSAVHSTLVAGADDPSRSYVYQPTHVRCVLEINRKRPAAVDADLLRGERAIYAGFCVLLLCPIVTMLYMDDKLWKLVILVAFLLVVSVLSVSFVNMLNKVGLALVAG
jgi:hypothetical protein